MKKIFPLIFVFVLTLSMANAQSEADRAIIISQTNVEKLEKLSELHRKTYEKIRFAPITFPQETTDSQGRIGYWSGVDHEGNLVYDFDDNVDAAKTARVDKIWTGGSSGFNLDGFGIQIGHWEAGGVARTDHLEFGGRVTHAEVAGVSGHSTHTACTMIGAGLNPDARGMASAATISSRRSSNDEAEIADFAAAGGIVSNHSYSTGNPDGDIPLYGVYTANSAEWDEILYNAPYLTICKSAGNNRNDNVNTGDNGYDLIYTIAGSKNLLTIGAVNDVDDYTGPFSVQQSTFSNWGPTDDWRIKPDLTTNGVSLFSANDGGVNDYSRRTGTSMSTPTTTGTVVLLQQLYHDFNSVFMKAATVKGLLINTADEVGVNDGPDFESGWGLLNAERAAYLIQNNGETAIIEELSLANGATYTLEIEVDGSSPLALALTWTDPAGDPVSGGIDDLTSVLVNDLDVRISNSTATYEPWTFTPNASMNNFTAPAAKGDNFRDNSERIDIKELPAGKYTVTVSHKNTLFDGPQDFSLVIDGVIVTTTTTRDIAAKKAFLVYPVPSENGTITIQIPEENQVENYEIQLFDVQGKMLDSKVFSEKKLTWDVSTLNPGLYFISIRMGDLWHQERMVISRK